MHRGGLHRRKRTDHAGEEKQDLRRLVDHGEFMFHLITKNTSGNAAGTPLLGQKGNQNKDSSVFTLQICVEPRNTVRHGDGHGDRPRRERAAGTFPCLPGCRAAGRVGERARAGDDAYCAPHLGRAG